MEIKKEVMRCASAAPECWQRGGGGEPVKDELQSPWVRPLPDAFFGLAPHRLSSPSEGGSEGPGWHFDLVTLPSPAGMEKLLTCRE